MGSLPLLLLELKMRLSPTKASQKPSARTVYDFWVELALETVAALVALVLVIGALLFVYLYCFPLLFKLGHYPCFGSVDKAGSQFRD